MKVYGHAFTTQLDALFVPHCVTFDTMAEALEAYRGYITEAARFGEVPCTAYLYIGEPDGDEEQYGFPDYPDRMIETGPRGGLRYITYP